jgi:hypothetical protein
MGAMQNKSYVRRHKTPTEKAKIVAAYERSGLMQKEFAAQQGMGLSTLQRWIRQHPLGPATGKAGLVEVSNLFGTGPAVGAYRLRFPRGLVLELASGFHPDEVHLLVQLVQNL